MARRSAIGSQAAEQGFTLVELLVVLFIVGLLASLALPGIQGSLTRAREAALLENLNVMRRSIDAFYSDTSEYPETLEVLVDERYLRFIPEDPVAEEDGTEWEVVVDPEVGGVMDVHSASVQIGSNGQPYRDW